MKVRVVMELVIADGGPHPAEVLEHISTAARAVPAVRVMGATVKEVPGGNDPQA